MAMTHERLAVSSGLHTILTNYRFSGSPNLQNPQPTTSLLAKIRVPQNGWFIMENPMKMDDLGVPLFSETSYIYIYILIYTPYLIPFSRSQVATKKMCFFLVMFFQGLPTSGVYSSIKNSAKRPTFLNF